MQYDLDNPEISNDADMYDAPKFYGGHLGLGTITKNNTWLAIDRRNKLAELGTTHTVGIKVAYPKTGPTDVLLTVNTCSQGNGPYKIQLVTTVEPLKAFYKAEASHQDYYEKDRKSTRLNSSHRL